MVAQAPVCGWGVDKSGEEYINWYQDFSDERKYAGMVNSYLLVAVERGLPALFAALSILAFLLFADFRLWQKNGDLLALALGLALLSLCVSNVFSTLWIVSSIRYTGTTIAAVSVIYAIFKGRKILAFAKISILSIVSAASICMCLYLAGLALKPKFISKHSDHITLVPNKPTDKRIAVIADKDTFGKYFGKTLRKAYVKTNPETVLDIYCEIPKNAEGYGKFIVTGKFAQIFQPPISAKIVYINPIGNPPPPSGLTNATIYLPRFDIYNQNTKWINAAQKVKIKCISTESPSAQILNTLLQLVF
nr:MAG TPA: rod shape determining protein [Caudoviricetes sp.]